MAKLSILGAFARGATVRKATGPLTSVDSSRGWINLIREPYTGAWQRNAEIRIEDGLCNSTVFSCISLISGDFGKLRVKLMAEGKGDVWTEVDNPAFSPVLRKPNRFQTRNQFYETWAISKQSRGNTIILKGRDERKVVTSLYILDWGRVTPLVAPDGSVYYQLATDNMAGLEAETVVPASEIIHDRWNCLYHPLVGHSPLYAAGWLVQQGQEILRNSAKFFQNGSKPGGILTAAGAIDDTTANRLKKHWEENFTGENAGRVAVLGDGLKYEAMTMSASEAQLVEQLKWSDEKICGIFRVPAYMVGVGPEPLNNNVEALAQGYYSRCLQRHFEDAETCLDEALGIGRGVKTGGVTYGVEFDLDGLLRMDKATQIKTLAEAVKGALLKPDEARADLNRGPVAGGNAVYLQQQNYSLEALAKRDASDDPFGTAKAPAEKPASEAAADNDNIPDGEIAAAAEALFRRAAARGGGGHFAYLAAGYNPDQPRDPGGEDGGQWVSSGGADEGEEEEEPFSASDFAKSQDDPDATPDSILDQFPDDTAEKIRTAEERLAAVEETRDTYKVNGEYTAERRALHDQILYHGVTRQVLDEETGNLVDRHYPGLLSESASAAATPEAGMAPTFTILGGRGGSGKSQLAGVVYDPAKAIVMDSDNIKRMLPEYQGWNAGQVHEEAGDIMDRATAEAKGRRLNIVHDSTMKTPGKAVGLVRDFKDSGYRVETHYMHLPRQVAAKRAVERFLGRTQRLVTPSVILQNRLNETTFDQVRVLADRWSFRDNNVPRGQAPVLIAEGSSD